MSLAELTGCLGAELAFPAERTCQVKPRNRRACPGELVQIDGSDHAWFEGRGPACTLSSSSTTLPGG